LADAGTMPRAAPGSCPVTFRVPNVRCSLCDQPIDPLAPYFRTTGSFLPAEDAASRLCNTPMHWKCYADWPERRRFARAYVRAWAQANRRNPFWWTVQQDEHVLVCVNPQPPVEEASVRLCAVGTDIRVPLGKWAAWLAGPELVTPALQPLELDVLRAVLPLLRTRFPDDHALVHAIDDTEKQRSARR
jgi:hypothetical protein